MRRTTLDRLSVLVAQAVFIDLRLPRIEQNQQACIVSIVGIIDNRIYKVVGGDRRAIRKVGRISAE